ncbi:hypothetical protein Tco_0560710 [Tanacetum coccineum]
MADEASLAKGADPHHHHHATTELALGLKTYHQLDSYKVIDTNPQSFITNHSNKAIHIFAIMQPPQGTYGQPPPLAIHGQPPPPQATYGQPPLAAYGQPPAPQATYGQPPLAAYGQPPMAQYGTVVPPQLMVS